MTEVKTIELVVQPIQESQFFIGDFSIEMIQEFNIWALRFKQIHQYVHDIQERKVMAIMVDHKNPTHVIIEFNKWGIDFYANNIHIRQTTGADKVEKFKINAKLSNYDSNILLLRIYSDILTVSGKKALYGSFLTTFNIPPTGPLFAYKSIII